MNLCLLQNQLPAAVASARTNTPHAPAHSALALDLRNSPTQAPTPQATTISAAPERNLLQMSPMRAPTQSDTAILDQSDAAILDQLNAAYQLPALPDSAAITKSLYAFYSRVNPVKAENVRSRRARTSKNERAILDC